MKDIKVSHIIRLDEMPDSPPFSGAENHLLFLLPELVCLDVDVELIVVSSSQGHLMQKAFDALSQAGVHVTLLPLVKKAKWYFLKVLALQRTFDLITLLRGRRDRIIHLHLDFYGAPIATWLSGCTKVVMSIHNDEEWLNSFLMRMWLRILNLIIVRYIAISDRVKDYFINAAGILPEKIERIYYGVELRNVLSPDQVRRKYNIPENRFVVGFIGRLVYQKNVDLLIDAAKLLPDIHFIIIGEGNLRDFLEQYASGMQNVQFLGHQPEGYEIMPGFDLFCLPSRFEGLGLVLVEAMLQFVPIIASRAGAIPEILGDGKYGLLFDIGDLNGLVSSIRYAKDNEQVMIDCSRRASEYAQSVFAIDQMISRTVKVYVNMTQK